MKILQVNKFFYPKAGADKYFLELSGELRRNGHDVRFFSMQDPRNLTCPDEIFFVSNISMTGTDWRQRGRAFGRILYSREAEKKFIALLDEFKPDVIHLHNIYHQISPSIISAAKIKGIPILMHLHDYKLICPNYKLFTEEKVCYRCRKKRYFNCLLHRCVEGSGLKSLAATLEMYYHHDILRIYENGVDMFIAPSRFIKDTVVSFGWPAEKIEVLVNFVDPARYASGNNAGDYLLYFGRLAEEKGIDVLIKAAALSDSPLIIAGEGPERSNLEKLAGELGNCRQVKFVGRQTGEALIELICDARAVVIPSVWPENMPLNLLESLAAGQTVIASNIGGIPEIIKHGWNGYLFAPGDAKDLSEKIKSLDRDPGIGERARGSVEKYNLRDHARAVERIYAKLISKK